MSRNLSLAVLLSALVAGALRADEIVLKQGERERTITGKVLVTAEDGGVIAMSPDGRIWPIRPAELVSHKPGGPEFAPLNHQQLTAQLKQELPAGFRFHET